MEQYAEGDKLPDGHSATRHHPARTVRRSLDQVQAHWQEIYQAACKGEIDDLPVQRRFHAVDMFCGAQRLRRNILPLDVKFLRFKSCCSSTRACQDMNWGPSWPQGFSVPLRPTM
jgi:hypothetical protein